MARKKRSSQRQRVKEIDFPKTSTHIAYKYSQPSGEQFVLLRVQRAARSWPPQLDQDRLGQVAVSQRKANPGSPAKLQKCRKSQAPIRLHATIINRDCA